MQYFVVRVVVLYQYFLLLFPFVAIAKAYSYSSHQCRCIVSPIAFVTGENEVFVARGVGSNPPQLPNLSPLGKEFIL